MRSRRRMTEKQEEDDSEKQKEDDSEKQETAIALK